MFTPSDIVIFILLAGSVIFIWIARRSSPDHQKDISRGHDREAESSAEQKGKPVGTQAHASHGQIKTEDAP